MYRLGIDVGGTNTDAVVLDEYSQVISTTKTHTTLDIEQGIKNAIHQVINQKKIDTKKISQAMLGTTQATNSIVERKNLAKVGVLRIGYPATAAIVPYTEWPKDMIENLSGIYSIVRGGYEFNGDPISDFDENEIRNVLEKWKNKVESIAIIGVFSSINNYQELKAAELVKEILGDHIPVSLSSSIGSIGLIGRENATILNASLYKVINKVTHGFSEALQTEGMTNCKQYLCQNDGTLMTLDYATKYPILTIGSGPTNSIRGAAYLTDKNNALTLDVGGTTADIGVLINDFPRESSKAVSVGGIQTNFRMPDILSIGLGGGTIVRVNDGGDVEVGPDSVGYKITEKALVFGGDVLTTTDIAVKLGYANIGNSEYLLDLDISIARKAMVKIQQMLEDGIDKMKTNSQDIELVLVGGGSIIVPKKLKGVKRITTSKFGGVANAIGATIARIGGEYEKVYRYADIDRNKALKNVEDMAIKQAINAGAQPNSVKIVEIEETPLAYAPGDTTRVKVKAVGSI